MGTLEAAAWAVHSELLTHPSQPRNRLPFSPSVTARIAGNVTETIRSAGRKLIPLQKLPSSEWSLSRILTELAAKVPHHGQTANYFQPEVSIRSCQDAARTEWQFLGTQ